MQRIRSPPKEIHKDSPESHMSTPRRCLAYGFPLPIGSKDTQMWFHNATKDTYYVTTFTNSDWALTDAAVTLVKSVPSVLNTGITNIPKLADAVKSIKTWRDVVPVLWTVGKLGWAGYKTGSKYYEVHSNNSGKAAQAVEEATKALRKVLSDSSYEISPGATVRVLKVNVPYLSPSNWGSLLNASDRTVLIANASLNRIGVFNANGDSAWVIEENQVSRAREGDSRAPEPSRGFWRLSASDELYEGMSLAPGESLKSPNGEYDMVYQYDGNLEVRRRDGTTTDELKWETRSRGTSPGRLRLQDDGNLVLYAADGKPYRAVNDYGRTPEHRNRVLRMQDDGNLVLYTHSGKPVWDTRHNGERMQK